MSLGRILVCAESTTAERFAAALRAYGYEVETATDGAAAMTLSERTQPAIVLTWSNLPGIEAVEFAQRLGALSPRPRVAVVVRSDDIERCADLLEVGVDALLLDDSEMEFLFSSLHRLGGDGLVVDPSIARALVARAEAGSPASEVGMASEMKDPSGGSGEAAAQVRVVEFQDCDLAEIVRTSVAEAAQSFPLITVEVHTPQALPAVAEPEALQGVVRILVDNACRRTGPGANVTARAKRGAEGLTVTVTARGSGGDGEGMGLDLARSLVALHGGILWSEPLPAGGTKLSFTLPPKPPALDGEEHEAAIQALELLSGIGTLPEEEPSLEESEPEGDPAGEFFEDVPDELEPVLDLVDIDDRPAADEPAADEPPAVAPEPLPSVPDLGLEASPPSELEMALDEPESDVAPEGASEDADLDLPLEPPVDLSPLPPVELGAAADGSEPPEDRVVTPPEDEAPPAEVEEVAEEPKPQSRWKDRRLRWGRALRESMGPRTVEPSEPEPSAEEPHVPMEDEALPTEEVREVEPEPASLAELQADVESEPDPAPEVAAEEDLPEPAPEQEPVDHPALGPADREAFTEDLLLSDEDRRLLSEDESPPTGEVLELEPDASVPSELEAGVEQEGLPLEPLELQEETELDLQSEEEPQDRPLEPPVDVEETPEETSGSEEELVGAEEAETPAEVEVSEGLRPRRRWKHRRKWGRAPRVPRSPKVEPSEEESQAAPPELEASPTGDLPEMEPEPEPDLAPEVTPEEIPQEEVLSKEVLAEELEEPEELEEVPHDELPQDEVLEDEVLAELPAEEPSDEQPSDLPVGVAAAAEEPGASEDESQGPPESEGPETSTIAIPDPEPAANATAGVAKATRPARELPPRPFVPDQFDSATQMLRGLTLDYEDEDVPVDPFWTDRRR